MTIQPINEALALAELGYRVFPCQHDSKVPATRRGCLDATSDPDKIAHWWGMWPEANIAVSTDGLLVVDVDPLEDGSPNPWLSDSTSMEELMKGASSITPRGGRHFWFREPTGSGLRSTTGKIAPGIDTRAQGGYVVVPPSAVDGRPYQWAPSYELSISPDQLPLPPGWILAALQTTTSNRMSSVVAGNEIPNGKRNSALASLAGTMRRAGMGQAEILAALQATNQTRCRPMLEEHEVEKIAWSVARYEPDQVSQAMAEGWYEAGDSDPAPVIENPGELPEGFCDVPGLLGDVVRWNLETAYKQQPAMALAAAIALMGVVTGRKITDRLGSRTNVYTVCVAPSGVGKEHARKVNKEVLQQSNLHAKIGPEGIGSHAGLVASVNAQSEILFQIDEIGRFLATVGNPGSSPHLYHVITVLLKMFSASNSLYVGDAYADLKKVSRIEQPHACLYGTTVPESFFDSLTTESLSDGFVGRLLVFEAAKPKGPVKSGPKVGDSTVPQAIIDAVHYWRDYMPGALLGQVYPRPRLLTDSPGAASEFSDLVEIFEAIPESERIRSAIWVRAHEKARKLAMMYSVSEDRNATEISPDAASWACGVVKYLTRRLEWLADRHIAGGEFDRRCQMVFRVIDDAKRSGLTGAQLCRATRTLRPRERSEVLDSLAQQGRICMSEEKSLSGVGRRGMRYVSANYS